MHADLLSAHGSEKTVYKKEKNKQWVGGGGGGGNAEVRRNSVL